MKNKILVTAVIVIFSSVIFLGWGDKGHKTIASYAMKNLSSVMKIPADWQTYVVEHAADPDYRKSSDKTEPNKHFIDIDFYKEFQKGKMIQSLDSVKMFYPDSVITKMGTLPWTVENTFNNLVKAFKEKNKSNILLYLSDIAHYVGDAHQPQHTSLNYNGQLTGQKGLHFRYEIDMLDSNLTELKSKFVSGKPEKINNIREYIFNVITRTNTFCDLLTSADKFAMTGKPALQYDDEYRKLMWYRTKFFTVDQFNLAGKELASVIYTAWLNSGKPNLDSIK